MTRNPITDKRLAEALGFEKWKGAHAPAYAAERIGVLALTGDAVGSSGSGP